MPLAIAVPSAAPLQRPHHFSFLHPSRKLALPRTHCAPLPPAEAAPVKPRPWRYPKQFPGAVVGIAEEMWFVAMRLRNPKRTTLKDDNRGDGAEENDESKEEEVEDSHETNEEGNNEAKEEEEEQEDNHEVEWIPSMEGFVSYLVDSKLVFDTVERIIAGSTNVAYPATTSDDTAEYDYYADDQAPTTELPDVYFWKSGLERSASIEKDLEWLREQGIEIPEPSTFGSTYAAYLSELAGSNAPAFLSHYYNIYFSHTTGGLAIGKKTCDKILEGRVLEFYKWDTDAEILLKDAREKLNELSKHWSRKGRNLCLKEAAKCFQHMGRIVRLIVS